MLSGGERIATDSVNNNVMSSEWTPALWWQHFCMEYSNLKRQQPIAMLQTLSKGIELFRADEFRRDPLLLKIWLAYLGTHFELYGDEEEVRRLFKFLKTERVGGDSVDLILHFAHFELTVGRSEKCAGLLETASSSPTFSHNEALRKAMVEFRLLGNFCLVSLIETQFPTSFISESIIGQPVHHETNQNPIQTMHSQNNQPTKAVFIPPPTPNSQETFVPSKITPMPTPMDITTPYTSGGGELHTLTTVPSSGIKASEEQRAALSHRIRRLGLGPPKRAVIGANITTAATRADSPNDSTVPRAAEPSPLPIVEARPETLSPTKTMMMAVDKENMSLTTV